EPALVASAFSSAGRQRHITHTGLTRLVHDLHHQPGTRIAVCLDHYRAIRLIGAHTLDVGTHAAHVHRLFVDPDLAVCGHRNKDIALVLGTCRVGLWPLHLDARLADKGAGDDKEDQHDENHIEHGRQINAGVFFLLVVMATHTHPVFLNRYAAGRPAGREPGGQDARGAPD